MDAEKKLPYLSNAKILPLWVLGFFTGWFIMQAELVGARALTPFFGNSIFVWGSVIAVFLLALSIGYSAGGKLTRKYDSHWLPAVILVAAGVVIGISVLFQNRLCDSLAASGMDARWGSLVASVILYAPPMILAGMIAPYAVHLATGSRSEAGSRAGSLSAISTLGSFIGSLVTSFILIPSFSLEVVMVGGGVMAAVVAVVFGLALSMDDKPAVIMSLAITAIILVTVAYSPDKIVSEQHKVYRKTIIGKKLSDADPSTLDARIAQGQKEAEAELKKYGGKPGTQVLLNMETAYHRMQVTQEGAVRMLTFGEASFKFPQTTVNLHNIRAHIPEYVNLTMAPLLYKQNMKRALIIGLGGGDIARTVEMCYPEIELDVVEIDPAVMRAALDYFFWKPSKNVTAYTTDGRTFVNMQFMNRVKPYDWVIIDAFDNDFCPFHMVTQEFFQVVQLLMTPDGVLAVNTRVDHDLFSYQARTIESVFGCLDAYQSHSAANVILCTQNNRKKHMTLDEALEARKKADIDPKTGVDLKLTTSSLLSQPNWDPKGDVLTDTWAPVEKMLNVH